MYAQIITIGDEILIGQIVDTNSAWMAKLLNLNGIQVQKVISISDQHEAIVDAIQIALEEVDLVLMTGGLGPTKDDITKKAIADYYQEELVFSTSSYEHIQKRFGQRGLTLTEAHREQCYMPANATLLTNQMGSAPGMWFEKKGKVLVSMPGVPSEMEHLMTVQIIPKIRSFFPTQAIVHRTILTVGQGESRLALKIAGFEEALPSYIKLAYLPAYNQVRLRLTATGKNHEQLEKELDQKAAELENLVKPYVFGRGDQVLEAAIGQLLIERGKTMSTAESCTGGYLAHRITSIAGSSQYFMGSVIAYDNRVKKELLNVNAQTLELHGAVSEPTVIQMVKGALNLLKTDIAVAISGIAGPGGGTPDKPVGTIWLAIGDKNKIETMKLQLGNDRLKNIQYTTVKALDMVRNFLRE